MERAVAWTDEMLLGIPVMDKAHKRFLDKLARLSGISDDEIGPGLFGMLDDLERDFREEEGWIARTFHLVDPRHCEDHGKVIRALRAAASDCIAGDIEIVRLTLSQLRRWYLNHWTTMDLPLAVAYELNVHHETARPSGWLRTELAHRLYRNGIAIV